MSSWRRIAAGLVVLVVLTVAAGCSDETTDSDVPSGVEVTSDPPTEPTGPESPQPAQGKPAVRIASLPIGGDPKVDGLRQCAQVNWLGEPIPDGVTVSIDDIRLKPKGVFRLDQESCGSDQRSCAEARRIVDDEACYVGVRQVAAAAPARRRELIIAGTVTCQQLPDCKKVQQKDGSDIFFTPQDFGPSPDESPTDSPTDTPTDSSPDESPTDSPTDSSPDGSPTG